MLKEIRFETDAADPLSKLAVLLGLCGLRRGEVRGLQWGDIDNDRIHCKHNFVPIDGLKKPKRGKIRVVPFPDYVGKAIEEVRKISISPAPENYVFESFQCPGEPMCETFFRNALRRELEGIGIAAGKEATEDSLAIPNEQKRRNLTFHSLRHTFVTLGHFAEYQIWRYRLLPDILPEE